MDQGLQTLSEAHQDQNICQVQDVEGLLGVEEEC